MPSRPEQHNPSPDSKPEITPAIRERVERLAETLKLQEQYERMYIALSETGITEILPDLTMSNPLEAEKGIIGIDGQEYPIPTYNQILERLSQNPERLEIIETKISQGFNQLLLVPFALPLIIFIERYKRLLLLKHQRGQLKATDKSTLDLDEKNPLYVYKRYTQGDADGELVYHPKRFTEDHQGQTKREIIKTQNEAKQQDPTQTIIPGWDIELIEDLPDLPAQSKGKTLNQRKQLEANKTGHEYLGLTQKDEQYQDEEGLTPEAWLTYAMTHLQDHNEQIDDFRGKGNACWLTGAYFPSGRDVPCACFNRDYRRAGLYGGDPGNHDEDFGCRGAVKV